MQRFIPLMLYIAGLLFVIAGIYFLLVSLVNGEPMLVAAGLALVVGVANLIGGRFMQRKTR